MYDDGAGAQHDFCIVCYKKRTELAPSAAVMVIGNMHTQHINSFGYCSEHLDEMITAFRRHELIVQFFDRNSEHREPADEALVKWNGTHAYYL